MAKVEAFTSNGMDEIEIEIPAFLREQADWDETEHYEGAPYKRD